MQYNFFFADVLVFYFLDQDIDSLSIFKKSIVFGGGRGGGGLVTYFFLGGGRKHYLSG